MLTWEGVVEFVAVAELESFTLASKRLNISTAQVSRQISALEKRLSTKLFYRTTRRVSLTQAGQIYYQHCRPLLDGLEEAERTLTNMQLVPTGTLRLTAPVTYGEKNIAPLVHDFLKQHPELEVQFHLTNQKVDLIAEGYDLAIRLGQLDDSSMMAKRLSSRTLYVCASPEYLATHGQPHSLSELEEHNCLKGTLDYWRFKDSGYTRTVRIAGNIYCNSGWALLDAALKGLGLVQLPDYYVQPALESGQLVSVLTHYQTDNDGIWGIYPHNRHLSPKVRMFLDFLSNHL